MNLEALAADPLEFIRELYVPTAYGPQPFGNCMAGFQSEAFHRLAPSLVAIAHGEPPPITRAWLERTKGASKDSDLACCLLWLLAFSPRPLRIQIGANDAEQADEIRLIVKSILRLGGEINELLATLLEVQGDRIVNKTTGSTAQILTRDSKGGHGARPDVLIVNELSHIQDETYAATLMDNADKMGGNGLALVASNAGFTPSWQQRWHEIATSSPRWWFQNVTEPAPWISEDDLAESRKRNSAARFNRLWRGQWVSAAGDALDATAISDSVKLKAPLPPGTKGHVFVCGVDLGVSRDASALVVLGKSVGHWEEQAPAEAPAKSFLQEVLADLRYDADMPQEEPQTSVFIPGDNVVRLAAVHVLDPRKQKVTLSEIEAKLIALHSIFNFQQISLDEWQAVLLAERLRIAGLPAVTTPPTGPNLRTMAQGMLDSFAEKQIELYDDEVLLADLAALRVVEKSYGIRLESSRGDGATNHADSASAFALALQAARRLDQYRQTKIAGPLLCWP